MPKHWALSTQILGYDSHRENLASRGQEMIDAEQNQHDVDKLREAMRNCKGPGNFRNLFVYAPNGKKDGIQILPVSDVATNDELFNIKGVTRDDVLAAHRVPPQLLGIPPNNTGAFCPKMPLIFSYLN